jgi:cell division septum initiation protein DivIVA
MVIEFKGIDEIMIADELSHLQQENEQLQLKNKDLVEALKPFKEVGDCVDIDFDYVEVVVGNKYKNKGKDFADNFIKAKEVYNRSVKSED